MRVVCNVLPYCTGLVLEPWKMGCLLPVVS
jgi:hypothetical protein